MYVSLKGKLYIYMMREVQGNVYYSSECGGKRDLGQDPLHFMCIAAHVFDGVWRRFFLKPNTLKFVTLKFQTENSDCALWSRYVLLRHYCARKMLITRKLKILFIIWPSQHTLLMVFGAVSF